MNPQIEIYTPNDWEKIREAGLKVMVDPMVFRTADVFLRGTTGVMNSPQPTRTELMWKAITSNIGSLCTFFDTLMKDPKSPVDLFKRAMKLRKSSIVKEYRQWRKEILEDIDKGRDLSKYKKELDIIIHALGREQKVDLEDDVTFNAKIGAKVASLKPDAEIGLSYEKKFSLKATYHDLLRNIPGYRYRKLLLRMTADQKGYRRLDKHLRKIWATS